MTAESQKNDRYNAARGRGPLAARLGRARHFRHQKRRPAAEILRAGDVPLPVGAHPHGPRAQLHHGRRGGALQTRHGPRRAAPDGLGRLRPAGRERRGRTQGASAGVDLRQHRGDEEAAQVDGAFARLGARGRDLRSVLLQAPAEDVSRLRQSRAGGARVPQGELGPGRPDRAGERAGDRRPRLALGRRGRAARPAPVGVQDQRLFGRAPGRARHARALAGEGQADAEELDRPLRRLLVRVRARQGDDAERRERTGNLHHAPRHLVRRQVHGDLARSSAGRGGGGEESEARSLYRAVPPHGHLAGGDRHRREDGLRHRHQGGASVRPELEAAGLRRQFHSHGVRHRRDFRLPGARPARPRFRQQIRARQHAGGVPAGTRSENLCHHRHRL